MHDHMLTHVLQSFQLEVVWATTSAGALVFLPSMSASLGHPEMPMADRLKRRTKSSRVLKHLLESTLKLSRGDKHVFSVRHTSYSIKIILKIIHTDIINEFYAMLTEMTPEQRHALEALGELPGADDNDDYVDEDISISLNSILDGTVPLDISHGGGEFTELAKAMRANLDSERCVMCT